MGSIAPENDAVRALGAKCGMGTRRWSNWAGNVTARPRSIVDISDESQLVRLVEQALDQQGTVKVVGSGHSFTPAAATPGSMVRITGLSGIRAIDRARCEVTVGAGTTLSDLNRLLADEGLAMPNLGDIAYQTVAGAISTSTHGTGAALTGLAARVTAMKVVTGTGEIRQFSREADVNQLRTAVVSVGALGVVTEYTLSVVPAFRLHAREEPMRLTQVIEQIPELVATNDHFEFFWIPHTGWALTKRNNRTQEPLRPLPTIRGWFDKTFMENYAFGAVCRVGRMRPSLIPRLATALPSSGSREYIDDSYRIFASPRLVKFYEMEYALPRDAVGSALSEVRAMVDKRGHLVNFPVEVRFTAADDIALSTAHGRESGYIAVHMYKGMRFDAYFADVEAIMRAHDGRPHWGKIHTQDHNELSRRYSRFNEFLALRDMCDPQRVFANDYTRQVFGQ